jgi:RNA polymerase sigma-70 factor (ECF subfamily)
VDHLPDKKLQATLKGCRKGKRQSQQELYMHFYNYAMSICLRYAHREEEAEEILNDGFMKVFQKIDLYSESLSFKGWLRRIMINASIDHYRKHEKHYHTLDIAEAARETDQSDQLSLLAEEELVGLIQQLPPAYRMVFNLYAIEGYTHEEIARQLNISIGTSKSNLSKARAKLQKMVSFFLTHEHYA